MLLVVHCISVWVKWGLFRCWCTYCPWSYCNNALPHFQSFCVHFFGRCIATNLLTKRSRYSPEGHLEVLPKSPSRRLPEFISVTSAVIVAQSGENVMLDCAARGSPIPELTWTFLPHIPGSKFRPLTNTSQNGLNVVTLHHVTPDHTGTYTCTASVALDRQTAPVTQVSSMCVGLYVEEGVRLCLIVTTCCHK